MLNRSHHRHTDTPALKAQYYLRLLLLLAICVSPACSSTKREDVVEAAQEATRVLPVRVDRYSFEAAAEMDASFSNAQIEAMFQEVNQIWAEAGIQWEIQGIEDRRIGSQDFSGPADERTEVRSQLQALAPTDGEDGVWQVVLIREFPVPAGGIYLAPQRTVYFAEVTRGGPTSPTILAHELGHSLGLNHEESPTNLMNPRAGGRDIPEEDATELSAEQQEIARAQADKGPSGTSPDQTRSENPQTQGVPAARKARMADRLRSFDSDGDGIILIEDVPSQGQRVFRRIDQNQDGRVTETELSDFEDG